MSQPPILSRTLTLLEVLMPRLRSLSLILLLPMLATAQTPANSRFEKLWADLADKNEVKATRAALVLASTPKETVSFLRSVLKPVKLETARFKTLLKELDNDEFETRDRAYKELEYFGKAIRAQLEEVLKSPPSTEVRNQVERLIEASRSEDGLPPMPPPQIQGRSVSVQNAGGQVKIIIDGKPLDLNPKVIEKPGPQPSWVRAARATAVLEHIGTPEAKEILRSLAAGEADVLPTKSAKEALDRLNQ